MDDAVILKLIDRSFVRPDGSKMIKLSFVMENPLVKREKVSESIIQVEENIPPMPVEEMRLDILLTEKEWQLIKKKYIVGEEYTIKIDKTGISLR